LPVLAGRDDVLVPRERPELRAVGLDVERDRFVLAEPVEAFVGYRLHPVVGVGQVDSPRDALGGCGHRPRVEHVLVSVASGLYSRPVTGHPHLLVERDGPVVTLTMNRPEARNALSAEMLGRMLDAW